MAPRFQLEKRLEGGQRLQERPRVFSFQALLKRETGCRAGHPPIRCFCTAQRDACTSSSLRFSQ